MRLIYYLRKEGNVINIRNNPRTHHKNHTFYAIIIQQIAPIATSKPRNPRSQQPKIADPLL